MTEFLADEVDVSPGCQGEAFGVSEDQHREGCRDHNGGQEVEKARQREALSGELIMWGETLLTA